MDGHTDLLGIGAFARRVGLTPSALRFYDDCRVLRPAHVDPLTGYRYYAPDQERRGRSLRTLREAGVPLAEATVVPAGSRTEAVAVLERHRRRTRERTRVAEAALDELLAAVTGAGPGSSGTGGWGTEPVGPDRPPPDPDGTTRVRLDGLELAGSVRQVVPSVERTGEHPVLGCVLIEVGGAGGVGDDRNGEAGEVRFVATDRYRLAVRSLVPRGLSGPRRAVPVPADALVELATGAVRTDTVELVLPASDRDGVLVRGVPGTTRLPVGEGEYPDHRMVLDGIGPPRHRVVTDRPALLVALRDREGAPGVVLTPGRDTVAVAAVDGPGEAEPVHLPAVWRGEGRLRIGFDPTVLARALEAGIGPDVLLEVVDERSPVVVRSADQGGFTTLVMPVALPGDGRPVR
ncbi:MerR family transcriptional regulator [Streptomyces calidiresistens]|uniref:MerR family transcriptional regulator n=1 Tax=Streptomyces calidiresistens TaxID=1485586 RepID=A0A7W3T1H7_9ACTN|nr:MerR family transcriptional regulator [Streptomyces calidiresistens]MBB0229189.1 MerR family transcriptional regulator [Streptomyces calidiresistens]